VWFVQNWGLFVGHFGFFPKITGIRGFLKGFKINLLSIDIAPKT
jgi:hypothetical protein